MSPAGGRRKGGRLNSRRRPAGRHARFCDVKYFTAPTMSALPGPRPSPLLQGTSGFRKRRQARTQPRHHTTTPTAGAAPPSSQLPQLLQRPSPHPAPVPWGRAMVHVGAPAGAKAAVESCTRVACRVAGFAAAAAPTETVAASGARALGPRDGSCRSAGRREGGVCSCAAGYRCRAAYSPNTARHSVRTGSRAAAASAGSTREGRSLRR